MNKETIVLKNGTIYTPDKIIRKGNILISGSKIKAIGDARQGVSYKKIKPKEKNNVKIIDVHGKIVSSGFIDVHSQGAGGSDILDGTLSAIDNISRTVARFGTTSFLATTVFNKNNKKQKHLEAAVQAIKQGTSGAKIIGIHIEGPFVNINKKGMIKKECIVRPNLKLLKKILSLTEHKLKLMTIAPELDGSDRIIRELRKRKIVASFGHSEASYEQTLKGFKSGITHVTHIFNAMTGLHHRNPGPLGAISANKDLANATAQLISDGVHVHPAVVNIIFRLLGKDRIVLITDSLSAMGLKDGFYVYHGLKYESKNGTCRYHDGTLIGTSLPLSKMAYRMMKITGASIGDVLRMVTINPAKTLGIQNKKGSISTGKDADIVVMDQNFNVYLTIVEGKIVWCHK